MALTLAQLAQAGPYQYPKQIGTHWVAHEEYVWIDDHDDCCGGGYQYRYTPLGTCPECVEAAMKDTQHMIEKPTYAPGFLEQGIIRNLVMTTDLMRRLPFSDPAEPPLRSLPSVGFRYGEPEGQPRLRDRVQGSPGACGQTEAPD